MSDTLLAQNARAILAEAAACENGIIVKIEVPRGVDVVAPALRAKQVLYRFKQENSDFSNLQIRLSPDDPDRMLWVINQRRIN